MTAKPPLSTRYLKQKKTTKKKFNSISKNRILQQRKNPPNYWEDTETHEFIRNNENRTCKICGAIDSNAIQFGLSNQNFYSNSVDILIQQEKYRKKLRKYLKLSEWEFQKLYPNPNTPDYKEYYELFKILHTRFDLPNSFFNEMYFLFSRAQNMNYFKKRKFITALIIFYHVMLKHKNFIHLEQMVEIYYENFVSAVTEFDSKVKLFRKHLGLFWRKIDRKPLLESSDYIVNLCHAIGLDLQIENKCRNMISSISGCDKIKGLMKSGIATIVLYNVLKMENLKIKKEEIIQHLNISKSTFIKYEKIVNGILTEDFSLEEAQVSLD